MKVKLQTGTDGLGGYFFSAESPGEQNALALIDDLKLQGHPVSIRLERHGFDVVLGPILAPKREVRKKKR